MPLFGNDIAGRRKPTLHNAVGHFRTITHHKLLVMEHCFKVGLYKQGLQHDLTKYLPVEFSTGARYWQGTLSPNTAERKELGVSPAWLHHKGVNKHHFEYWIDFAPDASGRLEGKPMPTRYVVEMFCDRVAACKVYQGEAYTQASALEYYQRSKASNLIHPDSAALLEGMLEYLAEHGEDEAFAAIRQYIVKERFTFGEHGRF